MKRLLIVDDEADHRLILRTIFEGCGYACEEAEDGTAALERLALTQMDLVLTDVNMPRTNGLQLMDRMSRQLGTQNTPVILITCQDRHEISLPGAQAKPFAILSKPFDPRILCATVASAIETAQTSVL